MTTSAPQAAAPRPARWALFAAHPPGLRLLFFTELWERFSFYGMRALLILYLTKYLAFGDGQAYAIYGSYSALVYIGPVLGGLLADRLLGPRRAVAFGGVLIALGHFTLAMGGPPAEVVADPVLGRVVIRDQVSLQLFFLGLAWIVAGEGFFKANVSTLVGRLYAPGDKRRDAGFTLFYMGINLGAFAATILCGWLATIEWAYGFGLAGIGMLIGLVVFFRGVRGLGDLGEAPDLVRLKRPLVGPLNRERMIYLGGAGAAGLAWILVQLPATVGQLLGLSGAAALAALIAYALFKLEREARDRLFVALVLSAFAIVFFALIEQGGSSLTLFADRIVNRQVMGVEIAAAQLSSLNPFFILLLAPLFSGLWPYLERRGNLISTPLKFALGLLLLGAGFVLIVMGAAYAGQGAKVALIWLVLLYFVQTAGELALSPIGLSMITKLSPREIVGFAMGVWFLATAAAQYLAAQFASLSALPANLNGSVTHADALGAYVHLFSLLAVIALFAAFLLVLFRKPLQRRMHGLD